MIGSTEKTNTEVFPFVATQVFVAALELQIQKTIENVKKWAHF